MSDHEYDLIVIGSGPGGYIAALRAAQLGLKTACIEKYKKLGGTCLNVGCIPSKALLQSTEYYHLLKEQRDLHGILCQDIGFDFEALMDRKQKVVEGLSSGIGQLFKKNKIDHIEGHAEFVDTHSVKVLDQVLFAKKFIIATGSKPAAVPHIPFDKEHIISSTEALSLQEVPKKMLVVGAGVIGVELASVYQRLGCQVIVVEMLDRVCPMMDKTVSQTFLQILEHQGIEFFLSSKVLAAQVQDHQVTVTFEYEEKKRVEVVDKMLVAVGRRAFTDGLGLEKIGVHLNQSGQVIVDDHFKTAQSHIYAIGDVIDGPMLAHKASDEGMAVAELIAGKKSHVNYMAIPSVVYTTPEAASVGVTEDEAKNMGLNILKGSFFFKGNPRARCSNATEGVVKIIADANTNKLVGMHIVGAHASELIQIGCIALEKQMTLEELAKISYAHPTFSEAIKDAVLAALKRTIHG